MEYNKEQVKCLNDIERTNYFENDNESLEKALAKYILPS
jgi:hypothetical protein